MNLTVFGDRVVLDEVGPEEMSGSLVLPQRANRQHVVGKVVAVGNGKVRTSADTDITRPMWVKPGDIVWFQHVPSMQVYNSFRVAKKTYLCLQQHDLLAKLSGKVVALADFQILGRWVLLESFSASKSLIVRPDNAQEHDDELRFRVAQVGQGVTSVRVEDEVFIDRMRASLVSIGGVPRYYIDSAHIYGTVG